MPLYKGWTVKAKSPAVVTHELEATSIGTADISAALAALQYLRPSSDSSVGQWTTHVGGTTNLYQTIDEVSPDDADYIQSERSPSTSPCVVKLSSSADPESSSDHKLSYRYYRKGTGTIDLTVQLREGYTNEGSPGDLIAQWQHNGVGTTVVQANQELSAAQANSITDYSDLYVRFVADLS